MSRSTYSLKPLHRFRHNTQHATRNTQRQDIVRPNQAAERQQSLLQYSTEVMRYSTVVVLRGLRGLPVASMPTEYVVLLP